MYMDFDLDHFSNIDSMLWLKKHGRSGLGKSASDEWRRREFVHVCTRYLTL